MLYFRSSKNMIIAEIQIWPLVMQVLNFLIPSLIVFGVTYYLIDKLLSEQRKIRLLELKKTHVKEITPIKLQAYERLTMYLDRISPENLVVRFSKSGQSAAQLRNELIQSVSTEYNHNISQQIYVSDDAWTMIKAVRDQILNVIEDCYRDCTDQDSGPDLGKKILTKLISENYNGTQRAIELLKKEIEIVF